MIKWDGFGKLLKQLFFGLLISCFTLLGGSFVNAFEYSQFNTVSVNSFPSPLNNQYDITFLKGGGLKTSFLGYSRNIFALTDNVLFWWAPNGLPYLYLYSTTNGQTTLLYNGYFSTASSCDSLTSGGNYVFPANCSSFSLWNGAGPTIFKNFFTNVNLNDIVYYKYYNDANDIVRFTITFDLCFNSESMNKSMCFSFNDNYFSSAGINLSGSLDLQGGNSFMNIPYDVVGYAPGQNGYMGDYNGSSDGSTSVNIDNILTGDYVYGDCTYKDILIALESEGYNKFICYGGLDNFSLYDSSVNYNIIPGSGLSILSIWGNSTARAWDNFTDFFTFWNGLYKDSSNDYTAMWESYPAVYHSYFQLYNQYKGSVLDARTVLEYCNLKLSSIDLNTSAGGYFTPVCESIIREKQTGLWNSRLDGSIYSGGVYTGDVPISVNRNGVGNMSGLNESTDGLNFIQNFFNKIKGSISTDYNGVNGSFLPKYIFLFLCAIILFRFLSH